MTDLDSHSKCRVLHVISTVSMRAGGPTAALFSLCELAKEIGIESRVAIAVKFGEDNEVVERLGRVASNVSAYSPELFRPFNFSRSFSGDLPRLVRAATVVHVHSMWNWASYWALHCACAMRKPAIIRPAGALDRFDIRKHRVAKLLIGPFVLRKYFNAPNLFHCTARRESLNLVTFGGNARREIVPLPVADMGPGPTTAEARRELELPVDSDVVLFLGRINYKKGLELLVAACAKLRRRRPKVTLLVAGVGDSGIMAKIERLVTSYGLGNAVSFLGFVSAERKRLVLAAADVMVLPSMNENFGVSVIEALAAGLPVVISREVYIADDIGGCPAVTVCERTEESIENAIFHHLTDGTPQPVKAANARALWQDNFSITALGRRYGELYRTAASAINV